MPPTISLNELYVTRREKEKKRLASFDRVLEMCHKRIRNIASFGGMNTFYEIPGMIIGFPLYNVFECCQYLMESLRKTGFLVQLLPPPHIAVVYVSWDPNEINPKPPQRKALAPPPSAAGLGRLGGGGGGGGGGVAPVTRTKRLRLFG